MLCKLTFTFIKRFKAQAVRFTACAFFLSLSPACSGVFYYPDRYLYYPPEKLQYEYQKVHFQSSKDSTALSAWFFPARRKPVKGTVIQFHGNAENISSHYLSLVWLVDHGFNLFTFDYRGYGLSAGEPTQEGTYGDGLAALEQGLQHYLENGKGLLIVVGQSLGGAVLMRALEDFKNREKVGLIVLDSTFMSYKTVARRVMANHWFTWIVSPLAPLFVSNEYSSERAVRNNRLPLLVIHDRKDPSVPFNCGKDIVEASSQNSGVEFWELEQGRHISVFSEDNLKYRRQFLEYLNRFTPSKK